MNHELRAYLLAHSAAPKIKQLTDEESLLEAGVIDSMAMIGLIAFLEGRFGIAVSEDEMTPENFDSVSAIAAYVQSKITSGP